MEGLNLRLGIDIDDVLYPWFHTAEALCEDAGITNGRKASSWRMWEDYGCSNDDWVKVIREGIISGTLYRTPIDPEARGALLALEDAGHQIHLITARGFDGDLGDLVRKHTADWLYYSDVPHSSLTFSKDKAIVDCDIYLDDGWHNVERLLDARKTVILMDAPHNLTVKYPMRVKSMPEFVSYVEWYAGGWAKTGSTPPVSLAARA